MRKLMFLLLLLIPLGGCAVKSDHMQTDLSAPAAAAPAQGESAVVFLRPSVLGGVVQAPVAEAVDGRLQFILSVLPRFCLS